VTERYALTIVDGLSGVTPRYNISRGQRAPVETRSGISELRWGVLAPWQGHGGKRRPPTHVATLAEIEAAPHLRTARAKQRCLVLADGVFAWRRIGKKLQPYWIHVSTRIAFAGVMATHKDDRIASFAIVTVPAPPAIVSITAEIPAVVDSRWLAGPALTPIEQAWKIDAVSPYVDDPAHDDPRCIEPLGNPAQGSLF
jgi:putative SOS response-associated peptidase YedK